MVIENERLIDGILPISVVIPCYNCSSTLRLSVASVMSQSRLPKEIILVDDTSTDQGKTIEVIKDIISKNTSIVRIHSIFLAQNSGPATARNIAWNKTSSVYVAFLDSDDVWVSNKLEVQWHILQKQPEIDLLGANIKSPIKKKSIYELKKINPSFILWKNPFFTSTVIIKRELPFRFPENSYFSEDFYLWAQLINNHNSVYFLDRALASNINNQKGLSANHLKMLKGEIAVIRYTAKQSFNSLILLPSLTWSLLKFIRRIIFLK